MVAQTGDRYRNAPPDTMKAWKHLPLIHTSDLRLLLPHNCVPVAVDIIDGARPLMKYIHPESAFYVFGPEDGTLGKEILSWCRDVIYVPTAFCMNLAAAVNVVLYDRLCKQTTNPKANRG